MINACKKQGFFNYYYFLILKHKEEGNKCIEPVGWRVMLLFSLPGNTF